MRCYLKYFLSRVLAAIFFGGAEQFRYFGRGHYEEQFCKIMMNLDK